MTNCSEGRYCIPLLPTILTSRSAMIGEIPLLIRSKIQKKKGNCTFEKLPLNCCVTLSRFLIPPIDSQHKSVSYWTDVKFLKKKKPIQLVCGPNKAKMTHQFNRGILNVTAGFVGTDNKGPRCGGGKHLLRWVMVDVWDTSEMEKAQNEWSVFVHRLAAVDFTSVSSLNDKR